jgi:hypothetical protein
LYFIRREDLGISADGSLDITHQTPLEPDGLSKSCGTTGVAPSRSF